MANTVQDNAPLVDNKQLSEDHLEIDIPEEDFDPGPECCIYKVPKRLREVKETAYTPQLISIGPIHHGNGNLAKMERQKLGYLKKFCERTSKETLEGFQSFIKKNVKRIYRCYDLFAFETEFETSKFVNMVLKDAVFIIELFLRHHEAEDDFLVNRDWLRIELWMDLILLENQLPFFVLENLYNLAFASDRCKLPFLFLTRYYFEFRADLSPKMGIKHFTDLARCLVIRNHPSNSVVIVEKLYSATMFHEAGVDFKATQYSDVLLDINVRFEKGELRIPTIWMTHRKEVVIRNLMALEQCHYPENAYVCSYIQLLDYLVNTDKDVDLLVKKGIFLNDMGSSTAVADMINTLMVGVARLSPCYGKIGKDLNQHYDSSWNCTKATLRHVYFNNLWRGTATVAASMLLLLTLTQTVFAILDRAMPTK